MPDDHIYIMILPRQCTVQSRKYLGKATDCWSYEIPLNVLSCWDKTQQEPFLLIGGISFPKFYAPPYEVKQHEILAILDRRLHGMCKFCRQAWSLSRV